MNFLKKYGVFLIITLATAPLRADPCNPKMPWKTSSVNIKFHLPHLLCGEQRPSTSSPEGQEVSGAHLFNEKSCKKNGRQWECQYLKLEGVLDLRHAETPFFYASKIYILDPKQRTTSWIPTAKAKGSTFFDPAIDTGNTLFFLDELLRDNTKILQSYFDVPTNPSSAVFCFPPNHRFKLSTAFVVSKSAKKIDERKRGDLPYFFAVKSAFPVKGCVNQHQYIRFDPAPSEEDASEDESSKDGREEGDTRPSVSSRRSPRSSHASSHGSIPAAGHADDEAEPFRPTRSHYFASDTEDDLGLSDDALHDELSDAETLGKARRSLPIEITPAPPSKTQPSKHFRKKPFRKKKKRASHHSAHASSPSTAADAPMKNETASAATPVNLSETFPHESPSPTSPTPPSSPRLVAPSSDEDVIVPRAGKSQGSPSVSSQTLSRRHDTSGESSSEEEFFTPRGTPRSLRSFADRDDRSQSEESWHTANSGSSPSHFDDEDDYDAEEDN